MFTTDALTFREFVMSEPLPLSTIHNAILQFLQFREDVVLFGAQAVNAYVDEPRMTQDIDLMSNRAEQLANEIQAFLHEQFYIAVRVRHVANGRWIRLFQSRKASNRHLVDIRAVQALPNAQWIGDIAVMMPADLIASKVLAYARRRGRPKAGTDWRDISLLLLRFPEYHSTDGPIADLLTQSGATPSELVVWTQLLAEVSLTPDDDEEFW